jgi:hypothetical protein
VSTSLLQWTSERHVGQGEQVSARGVNGSKDQTDALGLKLKNTIAIIGEFYSHQKIKKVSVGNDLVMHSYLVKYDRQPLRFIFTFYRPGDTWRLQNFKYDDSIDEELEEAIKAYRLKENLDY